MKFSAKIYQFIVVFLCTQIVHTFYSCANSLILPRSQSVDAARDLIGWQQLINCCGQECSYGAFSLTTEYQQTFNGGQMARCIFGNDVSAVNKQAAAFFLADGQLPNWGTCNWQYAMLGISGSQATNRQPTDWLADYFGLPTDFHSFVTFSPTIKSAIFDLNFYVGLDTYAQGLFFRIHCPIAWTEWNLNASEYIISSGANTDIPGYMSKASIDNSLLQKSFLIATDGSHGTFGDVTQDFQYGIIDGSNSNIFNTATANNRRSSNGKTAVHVADIEAAFGWNFLCCDDYHLGFELRGSAPAGNKPNAIFLFEPIVGNGHYWTLGGGLTSHYTFWHSCNESSCGIWLDANIEHLFSNCQRRSFDFKNKPNSRYVLLEQFKTPTVNLLAGQTGTNPGGVAPDAQYAGPGIQTTFQDININGGLSHAINQTTFFIRSCFDFQADVAVKLAFMHEGFEWALGYNFWTRSKEKICRIGSGFPSNTYALKGDAFIYGFTSVGNLPVALSATESNSDIHSGTNIPANTNIGQNTGIDNPQPAQNDTPVALDSQAGGQANTSLQPIFLSDTDIDYHGIPRSLTNRIFTHISYTGKDCENWQPFIGIGGSAEFAQRCNKNICNSFTCSISQWAMWLKAGVSYN